MEEKRGHCGSLVDPNLHLADLMRGLFHRPHRTAVRRLGLRVEKGDPGLDSLAPVICPEHYDRDRVVDAAEPVHAPS